MEIFYFDPDRQRAETNIDTMRQRILNGHNIQLYDKWDEAEQKLAGQNFDAYFFPANSAYLEEFIDTLLLYCETQGHCPKIFLVGEEKMHRETARETETLGNDIGVRCIAKPVDAMPNGSIKPNGLDVVVKHLGLRAN